ncbi:DUF4124 domain-containing protein [Methylobacillus arboreus]|uniref:DUF4124 domain-containing protein n=1 Tax=Methylobacillus arboreus TaxID=755170 RepID=UPI001E56B5EC|nr:DUF4124 domain-containing protein [Methylobacillus arboreus]MCB5190701.1 DUF4124 domain-containing protein [Methylobacillus arboreus]
MARILRLPSTVIALLSFTFHASAILAAAESKQPSGKIMKWVDEQGVTHYSDTLPPQYTGKQSNISPRGLPQADTLHSPAVAERSGKGSEQDRRDKTLQSVYSSEQEIDLARDRNLQIDQAMLEGLEQRRLSTAARLQNVQKTAADYTRQGKAVPGDIKKDLKNTHLEIGKIDEQIAERKQHMETTRQRFENDKKRFTELKTGVPAGENTSPAR